MPTLQPGSTSQAFDVDIGQTVSVTPGSGGTMLVEYTTNSETDIRNGSANWQAWTAGTVSTATSDVAMFPMFARVTAYTAAGSYELSGSGLRAVPNQYLAWKSDVVSARDPVSAAAVVGVATNTPYRLATFGDSRANIGGTGIASNASGTTFNADRTPTALCVMRQDMQVVFNGGLSGGLAQNWANNSDSPTGRVTALKTVADLLAANPDLCLFQFLANDLIVWDGSSPSTWIAARLADLQAACAAIMNGGAFLVYESTNPLSPASVSYVNGYSAAGGFGTNASVKLQAMNDINAAMQSWIANYPTRAIYVDTSQASAGLDGYAKTDKSYVDGVHFSRKGAESAASIINEKIKRIFPPRPVQSVLPTKSRSGVNGMLLSPTGGKASGWDVLAETGTWSAEQWAVEDGAQVVTLQCSGLSSGYCRRIITVVPSFIGAGTLPALSAGDVLGARVEYQIDDGDGGPPPLYGISIRPRLYYNDASNEFTAGNQPGSQTSTDYPAMTAHRGYLCSPGLAVKATMSNSTIIAPTALQFQIVGNQTGRTRIKFRGAEWRKISV